MPVSLFFQHIFRIVYEISLVTGFTSLVIHRKVDSRFHKLGLFPPFPAMRLRRGRKIYNKRHLKGLPKKRHKPHIQPTILVNFHVVDLDHFMMYSVRIISILLRPEHL